MSDQNLQAEQIAALTEQVALLTEAMNGFISKAKVKPKAPAKPKAKRLPPEEFKAKKIEQLKKDAVRLTTKKGKPYSVVEFENGKLWILGEHTRDKYIRQGLKEKAGKVLFSVYSAGWRAYQS